MFLEIFVAISIFSLVPITVKFTGANPFTIGLFRLLVATLLLSVFWNKKIDWTFYRKKNAMKLFAIGFAFFCHWITYTFSIKVAGPSMTVIGMATYGIQVIFYGAYFLDYKIKLKNVLCLMLILVGVFLVIPKWDYHDQSTLGLILALVSASFYAFIPIMLQKSSEFNQETRIFAQFSVALIGYAILSPLSAWRDLGFYDWGALFFLAIFGTFIAHTLWSRVVSRLPTTTTGIAYYLITPTAMILSYLVLGESLTSIQQVGGVVILFAAILNTLNLEKIKLRKR